jgi:transcriptional regulator with XRE-family HTH domain
MNKQDKTLNHLTVGNILKSQREKIGSTQNDIAQALGYRNINFISMIESGRSNIPVSRILDIINAYQMENIFGLVILRELHPDIWKLFLDMVVMCKNEIDSPNKLEKTLEKKTRKLLKDHELPVLEELRGSEETED